MKKWQRLEHRWDTRERAEREKTVAKAKEALTEAQIAEQRHDWAMIWGFYQRRLENPELYVAYEDVCQKIWAKHGHSEADITFRQLYQRMLDRKPVEAEPLIGYLERDVWEHGSGYAKARIIQFLKQADLTESERERLRRVASNAVEGHDRREFRRFCQLARKVDAPELHTALRARLTASDAGVRRRAAWMLYAMGERDAELEAWQRESTNYFLRKHGYELPI